MKILKYGGNKNYESKKAIGEKSKDICKITILFFLRDRLNLGTVVFLSEIFTRH